MGVVVVPLQSYLGWKVAISFLHTFAIASTLYRLIHRFRIRRLWWDDYLVLVPVLLNVAICIMAWIRFSRRVLDPSTAPRWYQILNSYWLSLLPYLISVWASRVALGLSLARIFPKKHRARMWSFLLVAFLVVSFVANVLVTALTCKDTSWFLVFNKAKYCISIDGKYILAIAFGISDTIICDVVLLLLPLIFLWRVKLPQMERRLILGVFCGSALSLAVAVAFAILFLNSEISAGVDYVMVIGGLCNIEEAVCLFAANLTVVSTSLYRVVRRHRLRNQDVIKPEISEEMQPASEQPRPCVSEHSRSLGQLTLTEISMFSSPSQSHRETANGLTFPTSI